jgi:hypothetical protein
MRLLSFVPCGCRAGPIDDAPPADQLQQQQQAAAACRDGGAAARRRRRRARSLGGSPQWRPALGDIYEGVAVDAAGKAAAGGGRVVPARPGARVLPRAHSREYRYTHIPISSLLFSHVDVPYELVVKLNYMDGCTQAHRDGFLDAGVRADGVPVLKTPADRGRRRRRRKGSTRIGNLYTDCYYCLRIAELRIYTENKSAPSRAGFIY